MNLTATEQKVVDLRAKGWTNAKIAKEIGRTKHTVDVICHHLIQAGLLAKRKCGNTNPLSDHQIEVRLLESQVITLRELGQTAAEIAKRLDKEPQYIEGVIERLRMAGRIKKVSTKHDALPPEEWERREQLVLPHAKEGKKAKDIAELTGLNIPTVQWTTMRLAYKGIIPRSVFDRRERKTKRKKTTKQGE